MGRKYLSRGAAELSLPGEWPESCFFERVSDFFFSLATGVYSEARASIIGCTQSVGVLVLDKWFYA